jgi:aminomethyltransferase
MGYTGEKGYEVNLSYGDALKVWEILAAKGCKPFGVYAIEVLRCEAGLVLIYIDYRLNDMSPFDLSMDHCIKFHPDCVGTEALKEYQKILPYRLKSLKIEGDELPAFHTGVYAGKEPVGLVKTVAKSPLCGSIAMAMISTLFADDGTELKVQVDSGFVAAEVAPICIFDPQKKKVRA